MWALAVDKAIAARVPKITIGRDPAPLANTVLIGSTYVSRRQAEIVCIEPSPAAGGGRRLAREPAHEYTITDLGSANGTFVGSKRLRKLEPQLLVRGDLVTFGPLKLDAPFQWRYCGAGGDRCGRTCGARPSQPPELIAADAELGDQSVLPVALADTHPDEADEASEEAQSSSIEEVLSQQQPQSPCAPQSPRAPLLPASLGAGHRLAARSRGRGANGCRQGRNAARVTQPSASARAPLRHLVPAAAQGVSDEPRASQAAAAAGPADNALPLGPCKQEPKLIERVCELGRAGCSPSAIDHTLSAEGFTNSSGRPWAKKNDGKVVARILRNNGIEVSIDNPRGILEYAHAYKPRKSL
jgi:hypothetical protein